jgi:hypothetical protein
MPPATKLSLTPSSNEIARFGPENRQSHCLITLPLRTGGMYLDLRRQLIHE